MVSELGANWCTKVKVDEATDCRIGASNLGHVTAEETASMRAGHHGSSGG
jgi:hypothetical protein